MHRTSPITGPADTPSAFRVSWVRRGPEQSYECIELGPDAFVLRGSTQLVLGQLVRFRFEIAPEEEILATPVTCERVADDLFEFRIHPLIRQQAVFPRLDTTPAPSRQSRSPARRRGHYVTMYEEPRQRAWHVAGILLGCCAALLTALAIAG